jgi:hypothetical protein
MSTGKKNDSIAFALTCDKQLMKATVLDIFKEPWFVDLPKNTQHLILYNLGRQSKKSNDASEMFEEPWFENLPQKTKCLIIFTLGSNNEGQKTGTEKHVTQEIAGSEHSIAEEFPIAEKNLEDITGAEHNEHQFPDTEHNEPQFQDTQDNEHQFPDTEHNEHQFQDTEHNEPQFQDTEDNEHQFPDTEHNEPQFQDTEDNAEEFFYEEDVTEEQFKKGETDLDNLDGSETSFIGSNLDSFERSVRVLSCSPKASLNENSYQIDSTKSKEVLLDNPESINNWNNLYYSDSSEDEEELQQRPGYDSDDTIDEDDRERKAWGDTVGKTLDNNNKYLERKGVNTDALKQAAEDKVKKTANKDDQKHSNVSLGSLANLTILSSNSETSMQQKFKKFNKPNKKRATTTRPKRATKNHYEISDGSDFCDETSKTVQSRKTSEKGNGERVSAFISNPYGKKQTVFGTIVNQVSIS